MMINSLQNQQSATLLALYDDYASAFYGEIKRNLFDTKASEQALIDSFGQIRTSIDEFDPSKERLFTWCFKIVRKEIRKKKVDLLLKEIFMCQRKPILIHA